MALGPPLRAPADPSLQLRGIPVLFIPGNAGSYKQVRPIAAEAANYFHHTLQHDGVSAEAGVRNLDFFTVDFNEDITAFHGQTLLDQAEYLNEAIRYILSLYSDPQRADRDSQLPDPTSVVILGHSMGGVVARAMLVQPNYQSNSINTVITMSAPHSRPPVTFDGQIVQIYDEINDYWRHAYAQKWANDNPCGTSRLSLSPVAVLTPSYPQTMPPWNRSYPKPTALLSSRRAYQPSGRAWTTRLSCGATSSGR